jgi:hypothetical protein
VPSGDANDVEVTSTMVYVPNPDFVEELIKEPEVVAAREGFAADALLGAQGVALAISDSGDYLNSLYQDGAEIGSTDPGAVPIEYGSINNPPFAPLRRGVDGTGVEMRDTEPPSVDDDEQEFGGDDG